MQVNFLIININLNPPKITAMGVFEIGPNLFPTVSNCFSFSFLKVCLLNESFMQFIGITMTYLTVLWQFQSTFRSG